MNNWLEQHRLLTLAVIGLLIAAALGAVAVRAQPAASMTVEPPLPTATPGPTATPAPLQVYVSGAVTQPDVYTLPPGAIVRDLLDVAGGVAADADLNHLNLAQPLGDGDHIHVPMIGEEPTPAPANAEDSAGDAPALTGPLNINTATAAELELLPGIGPVTAESIISYRESVGGFASIEQIQNVTGIGPAKYDAIKELIVVE